MKKILLFIICFISAYIVSGQVLRPANFPSPNSPSGYALYGFMRSDSGYIYGLRDTFPALKPTIIWHNNNNFYKTPGGVGSFWTLWVPSVAGTVQSFGKVDNFGIISSVTNPTTIPVYTAGVDTVNITSKAYFIGFNALNVKYSDTTPMMSPYLRKSDTASMIGPYLRKSDTASMVGPYVRQIRRINTNAPLLGGGDLTIDRTHSIDTGRGVSQVIAGGSLKKVSDSLAALISGGGFGTVTQVNTNNGSGITGGPITNAGTIAADTLNLSTRKWRQKGIDSINSLLPLKVNVTDLLSHTNGFGLLGSAYNTTVARTWNIDTGSGGLSTWALRQKLADSLSIVKVSVANLLNLTNSYGILGSAYNTVAAQTWNIDTAWSTGLSTRLRLRQAIDSLQTNINAKGPGTVTSVGLLLPAMFTVSGSPVTTSGTLTATLANQNANLAFIGPPTGAPAQPTFRALVSADIPDISGTYIKNQITQQASSNFNISGAGVIGGSVTATSIIKSGGTSSQFLKADGSVDASVYLTSASAVTTFSAGTTGFTPSSATSGAVTLAGILASTNGGSGINNAGTLTWGAGGALGTAAYVADAGLVHIAGTETITGTKTFNHGIIFKGVIPAGSNIPRNDITALISDSTFPFIVGYISSSVYHPNDEFGIAGYGRSAIDTSVKLGSINFKPFDTSRNNFISQSRLNVNSKVLGVTSDHNIYNAFGNGTFGSIQFLSSNISLPTDGDIILEGNRTIVRQGGATIRNQRFGVYDFGIDEFSSTPRMNAAVTNFTGTKGILFGYDQYKKQGVIGSLGNSSGLSFWVNVGGIQYESLLMDSLLNTRLRGDLYMPSVANVFTATNKRVITWNTSNTIAIGDIDNTFTGTLIYSGGVQTISLNNSGAVTFASSVTATSLIKSGGTSSQFLKADGSVDATAYLPIASPTFTGIMTGPNLTLTSLATGATTDLPVVSSSGIIKTLAAGSYILNTTSRQSPANITIDGIYNASNSYAFSNTVPYAGMVNQYTISSGSGAQTTQIANIAAEGILIANSTGQIDLYNAEPNVSITSGFQADSWKRNTGGISGALTALTTRNLFSNTGYVSWAMGLRALGPEQENGQAAFTGTIFNYASIYINSIRDSSTIASKIINSYAIYQKGVSDTSLLNGVVKMANNTSVGSIAYGVATATDAAYTVPAKIGVVKLPVITAARTITLPTTGVITGQILQVWNQNTSGFAWSFSPAIKDASSVNITTLINTTWYVLTWDGTNWAKTN